MQKKLKLLRVPQAREYMHEARGVNLSERTLRQWILLRKIDVTKIGGMVFVSTDSLDSMIKLIPAIERTRQGQAEDQTCGLG
jgi:hypothetical protein